MGLFQTRAPIHPSFVRNSATDGPDTMREEPRAQIKVDITDHPELGVSIRIHQYGARPDILRGISDAELQKAVRKPWSAYERRVMRAAQQLPYRDYLMIRELLIKERVDDIRHRELPTVRLPRYMLEQDAQLRAEEYRRKMTERADEGVAFEPRQKPVELRSLTEQMRASFAVEQAQPKDRDLDRDR